jgi:membrane-associated phospholipid phosphatase
MNWTSAVLVLTFCTVGFLSVLGCRLTSLNLSDVAPILWPLGLLLAMFAPIPAYWHQKGDLAKRDAALTIPACLLIVFFVPVPFLIGARLHLPLRDVVFTHMDSALGIHGSVIIEWAARHRLGHFINYTYYLLLYYMGVAILVPSLLGKSEARRFLLANVIALCIGIVCFTLFPAIGPWYGEHFPATIAQQAIQDRLLAVRQSSTYSFSLMSDGVGIVAFPSFHAIWAIFAASALWGFRYLRIPLVLFSALIIASTMTSGWHYFVDVFAGIVVAVLSLRVAGSMLRYSDARTTKIEVEESIDVLEEAAR